jgi:hypothetical protein
MARRRVSAADWTSGRKNVFGCVHGMAPWGWGEGGLLYLRNSSIFFSSVLSSGLVELAFIGNDLRRIAIDQVLVEVPLRLAAGDLGQLQVEGVGILALDRRLAEHRELDAVGQAAEIGDFLVAAGFLLAKVVGRKAEHDQPLVPEPGIELFQPSYCEV